MPVIKSFIRREPLWHTYRMYIIQHTTITEYTVTRSGSVGESDFFIPAQATFLSIFRIKVLIEQ